MTLLPTLLLACDRPPVPVTEIGNPERSMGVYAATDVVVVTSVWVALGPTTFEVADGTVVDTPDLVADLTQGPYALDFSAPDAGYDRIVVRLDPGTELPPDAPDDLAGNSIVVDGVRDDGVPFRVVSADPADLVLDGPFSLGSEDVDLALGFATGVWFADIDLYAAAITDGTIRIDGTDNHELLGVFESALGPSVTLAADEDGDGVVGHDDPVLVSGDPHH